MDWDSRLAGQAQQLVHRERQDTEHQMSHDFLAAAYPDEAPPKFIFDSRVHTFAHSAFLVTVCLRPTELTRLFLGQDVLGSPSAIGGIDDRPVAQACAMRMNLSRIVS